MLARLQFSKSVQPLWQRILLLVVLGYEAAGCLLGGSMLMINPDGSSMKMPVELLHGAFPDFFVPGIILFLLGILNSIAFFSVLRRKYLDWLMASVALGGLLIWFWVEIAILLELHWLHAMWGLPVIAGALAVLSLFPVEALRMTMLACGIASSLLYAAINIIVPAQCPEYNSVTQTVSELSAIGAPTRALWIILCTPYSVLLLAFGTGVWRSAYGNRKLRIVGTLLFIYGLISALWVFAPMHLRETLAAGGSNFSDTMHLTLAGITNVIYITALIVAAQALPGSFKVYSYITLTLLVLFGMLTFLEAPNVNNNGPTPYIGLWERLNIGLFLLWIIVLAFILWRKKEDSTPAL